MSSESFEVRIRPDPLARVLVTGSGAALTLAGAAILLIAQLPPAFRGAGLLLWILMAIFEFRGFHRAYRQVHEIVIDASGSVSVFAPDGQRAPATCLAGSFAIPEIVWIRLRLPDGSRYGELLIRQSVAAADWHRLHLIWQLGQRTFGHPGPA